MNTGPFKAINSSIPQGVSGSVIFKEQLSVYNEKDGIYLFQLQDYYNILLFEYWLLFIHQKLKLDNAIWREYKIWTNGNNVADMSAKGL